MRPCQYELIQFVSFRHGVRMGLGKPVIALDGPLGPIYNGPCLMLLSFLSAGTMIGMGQWSLTSTGQSASAIRLLCFLPKLSPFRRVIRGRALLCAGKSTSIPSCSEEMVKAIRIHELGGTEVLKWEDVEVGEPKEGEIRVRNKAIGVNFIDVYFRKGVYKAPSIPFIPGWVDTMMSPFLDKYESLCDVSGVQLNHLRGF